MKPKPEGFHYLRLEVTVEAALVTPEYRVLGGNFVDATVVFGWRTDTPPPGATDEAINAALTKQMSGVLALVQGALELNGWLAMGQAEDRMGEHARTTGVVSHTEPTTIHVRVVDPDDRQAVHD